MSHPLSLSPSEATCLEALRSGIDRKMLIALRAGLNLKQTSMALRHLAALGLATTKGGRAWNLTLPGQRIDIVIAPAGLRHGRKPNAGHVIGAGEARLLAQLNRPRRGAELAALLHVTRQRVHQLVVALSARGLIRSVDPGYPTFAVARRDDTSILLAPNQERVLSAFPPTEATTLPKIALATNMPAGRIAALAQSLLEAGLIARSSAVARRDLYCLTAAGAAHWQRSPDAREADLPPAPFRSGRVHAVLSLLRDQGPTRTRDVGVTLGLPATSMNALMQYLKRRAAVRTQSDARHAPYELTQHGREILAAMTRTAPGLAQTEYADLGRDRTAAGTARAAPAAAGGTSPRSPGVRGMPRSSGIARAAGPL